MLEPQAVTDLIRRCRAGDAAAQSEFIVHFGEVVRRAVAGQLARRNPQGAVRSDVDDLQQDVFEHLMKDHCRVLESVRDARCINAWLVAVCRNRVVEVLRREARRSGKRDALLGHYEHVAEERAAYVGGPAEEAIRGEVRREVARVLAKLSPAEQLMLRLFYLEGLTYSEIGDITGEGLNTIASRLKRSRQKLRVKLARLNDGA